MCRVGIERFVWLVQGRFLNMVDDKRLDRSCLLIGLEQFEPELFLNRCKDGRPVFRALGLRRVTDQRATLFVRRVMRMLVSEGTIITRGTLR